jgi:hypothetical protein
MSDKKISNLNELATALSGDLIPIVDSTTNETKFIQKGNLIEPASFIENIVFKTNSDSVLDVDKLNWVTLSANHSMTIPTADISNIGKILIVNNRSSYELTIDLLTATDVVLKGADSVLGVVCVTNGSAYNWEVFSRYNKGDFDTLVQDAINDGVTTIAPSQNAVFDALALKSPISSPTFTGTVTTPDINVSSATASTPTFFDASKKLITTTAQLWGTWVQAWSNKATPVDADTLPFYNSASTFVGVKSTLLNFWTAYLLPKVQALGYLTGSGITANYIPYWNGTNMINSIFQANTSNLVGNNNYSILNSGTGGIINIGTTGTSTAYVQLFSSQYIVIQGTLGNSLYGTTNIQTSGGANRWAFNPSSASLTMSNTSNVVHSFWDSAGLNIGGNGASVSAILQLDSTTKGFLPPRMTNAQRTAISSPAIGLMVYCTDATEGLYIYKSTGWTFII